MCHFTDIFIDARSPLLSAYMLWLCGLSDWFSKVTTDSALEHFHQEAEQRPRQCSIPSAFRFFISDERMLGLHLQELYAYFNDQQPYSSY